MQWDDSAYLLSKIKYNENSVIAEVYTEKHGKCSGIIFGASSKKIKNYLQIGNKLYVNYKTKNENKLGYFQIEISKAYSPLYFDSKKKLLCIISSMNLIKLLTADSQENKDIFDLIDMPGFELKLSFFDIDLSSRLFLNYHQKHLILLKFHLKQLELYL